MNQLSTNSNSPTVHEICNYLDGILQNSQFQDLALNGLQVEGASKDDQQVLKKAAFAVDAGSTVIEKAVQNSCDLIVVHHGIFWGELKGITGSFANKISTLLKSNCSLYASHLPLDGHLELGNAAQILMKLQTDSPIEGFGMYKNCTIGATTDLKNSQNISQIAEQLEISKPFILGFGPLEIKKIAVVTGQGSSYIEAAKTQGLDLLITGEPKHQDYHMAKELRMNVLYIGHYNSEIYGVIALKEHLSKKFKIETIFIDEPTGI